MGRMIDDSVKQKLLDSLAKEPPMVISTAYAYAKNYVLYGEDITKAWTTAVQQVSILEQVKEKAWVEAYDSFKKEYEARLKENNELINDLEELRTMINKFAESYETRLKADMVAMLTDVQLQIEEIEKFTNTVGWELRAKTPEEIKKECSEIIQQKINALRGKKNDN